MHVALVDPNFDVVEFEQLPKDLGAVEVKVGRGQQASRYMALAQHRERLDKRLQAARLDKRHREVEALAVGKLSFEDREQVDARGGAVRHESRVKAAVRIDV